MTTEQPTKRPRGASVSVVANGMASQTAFMAKNQGREDRTQETITTEDGTGVAVHTRPGTVVMYKPTERSGYMAKTVSVSAMPMLFHQGWQEFCPDCRDHHVDRNGAITTDPNACRARNPVGVAVCPVCSKRVYDNMTAKEVLEPQNDPNVIDLDMSASSDPKTRLQQKMGLHLWVRHPEWAQANGVPQLPTAFRDMVESATAAARSGVGT